ncbi:hypothetical protein EWE75_12010 [Sphingomonas populi]|uniref:Uncharacterized protein n=1 Tax=Sphingomonas populi TaxID=2484750 RepID=A0A4Q6XUK1_9SPHN|nr:hypothetical protein [Sphingomonas populi]RZF64263.1 hypothetical protein EWE75_12010 [Sphingomonas populi]
MSISASTAAETYCSLGGWCLEPGTWANWVSGIASSLAVLLALSGYFFAFPKERRQKRAEEVTTARQLGFKIWRLGERNSSLKPVLFQEIPLNLRAMEQDNPFLWMDPPGPVTRDEVLLLDRTEIALLMKFGEIKYAGEITISVENYLSNLHYLDLWREMRDSLFLTLRPAEKKIDGHFLHPMNQTEETEFLRRGVPINTLIADAQEAWTRNDQRLKEIALNFKPLMQKHLRKKMPGFSFSETD